MKPKSRVARREIVARTCRGKAVAEQGALKAVLRRSFRYTAAVSLQWVLFGSGGHKERPPGGQLRGFQRCTGVLSKQMKCLGSSFWLHQTAAFLPKRTQQCTLRCAQHVQHAQHACRANALCSPRTGTMLTTVM